MVAKRQTFGLFESPSASGCVACNQVSHAARGAPYNSRTHLSVERSACDDFSGVSLTTRVTPCVFEPRASFGENAADRDALGQQLCGAATHSNPAQTDKENRVSSWRNQRRTGPQVNSDERRRRSRQNRFNCVYCGEASQTKDHVPPRGIFGDAVPSGVNLITVPACIACNSGYSADDTYFRDFLS